MRTETSHSQATSDPARAPQPLLRQDLPAMVALVREATAAPELGRSIYAGHGVVRYLETLASRPGQRRFHPFWGIKDTAGRLLAAAHLRLLPEGSHLNQLVVAPGAQGRGLGSRLLAHWDRLAQAQDMAVQTLDVDEGNERAYRLYTCRGFRVSGALHEFRLGRRPPPADCAGVAVEGWGEALEQFRTFGFARFRLDLEGWGCWVDLARTFRTPSADPRILAFLDRLDPGREILLRSPGRDQPRGWEHTATLLRMRRER